jgi:hypothetical protein
MGIPATGWILLELASTTMSGRIMVETWREIKAVALSRAAYNPGADSLESDAEKRQDLQELGGFCDARAGRSDLRN